MLQNQGYCLFLIQPFFFLVKHCRLHYPQCTTAVDQWVWCCVPFTWHFWLGTHSHFKQNTPWFTLFFSSPLCLWLLNLTLTLIQLSLKNTPLPTISLFKKCAVPVSTGSPVGMSMFSRRYLLSICYMQAVVNVVISLLPKSNGTYHDLHHLRAVWGWVIFHSKYF